MATKKTTTKQAPARKATAKKAVPKKAAPTTPAAKRDAKAKKLSAIDAAAKVLATAKQPMSCKELIEAMAKKKLWTSPGGKTPWATLYSAMTREIATKGKTARFQKTERGKFTATK